jgi:flagellar biosynthesis/type III secretory pathway protein FliH
MQDIEDIQRRAYEEGFASGERAGLEAGEQKAAVQIERLDLILEEIATFKENMVEEMEEQVVELAIAMARKIIIEEITTRPEVIVSVVREALKRLQRMGNIMIKINPTLHDLFMKKKSELIDIHKDITFDVNTNVSLTGPLVIGHTEEVVTDINALIENIMEEVRNVRGKAGPKPGRPMSRTAMTHPETCRSHANSTGQKGSEAAEHNETDEEAVQL